MSRRPRLPFEMLPPAPGPAASAEPTQLVGVEGTYQLGQQIGRGGGGDVFQAWDLTSGSFVAVKRLEYARLERGALAAVRAELELLRKLRHEHIVRYVDAVHCPAEGRLYAVLEYMENGSLAGVRKRFGTFSEALCAIYMGQVLSGLRYLHAQGVLHCDLKPENMLLDVTQDDQSEKIVDAGSHCAVKDAARLRLRLCDFGLSRQVPHARHFKQSGSVHLVPFNGLSGTAGYISPEQLQEKP